MPSCSPGWKARRRKPEKRRAALFRPVMLSNPVERRRPREARPGRLCRRMEMGRHPRAGGRARAACAGSIRAPATTSPAPFPTSSRRWISTARSTANCWSAGRPSATGTFSDLQQRLNRKTRVAEDARAISGLHALLRPAAGRRRGPARPALHRAARAASKRSSRTLDPTRFDLSPLVAFADWAGAGRACAGSRRIRSSKA